ncbi:G-type lectin S-receptor-like serine/threonine-protein kinase SD2-5 [Rosa sericea]
MGGWNFVHFTGFILLSVLLLSETCLASVRNFGKISPGFQGAQHSWIDNDGLFLLSNQSDFAFGFVTTPQDVTLFLLCIVHMDSMNIVWTANRGSPVSNTDKFVFDDKGSLSLQKGGSVVWSIETGGKSVTATELRDSGNLVLLGGDNGVVWQSFSHPTDTLLWNQEFQEGMKLQSEPSSNNVTYILEIKSGDLILSAGFQTPQPYWSMGKESRKAINTDGGAVTSASISANSWKFYDSSKVQLWQFIFSSNVDVNATWIAVLGNDGFISFSNLQNGDSNGPSTTKIPGDPCSTPEPCDAYFECFSNNKCQCPSGLSSHANCKSGIVTSCSKGSTMLTTAGDGLYYFALGFVSPSSRTHLEGCKSSCLSNCSCVALFYQNSTRNCYMFDRIGSFQDSDMGFVSYVKVLSDGGSGGSGSKKHFPYIAVSTVVVFCGLLFAGYRYYQRKRDAPRSPEDTSEEDNFLENLTGIPIRFSYKNLQTATNNFSKKLGQGGFGSVYEGVLPDGTRLAVKKLEGIGQGQKEFRAEVTTIGSIHHFHLVRLKGFCAEGSHRLLAYEYMANGSLDKWIFKKTNEECLLDWETRFNIAVGTAKGLAYLHEDCVSKIIHCDIKPQNVLLDNNYHAKVADFGLAKLMTKEQSHVFTTLRGTRGYLAPEWITNRAISEKSDVYSYGMLLLEIIGGRKNYDQSESSEKSQFPSYAFKMLKEGKMKDIVDSKLKIDDADERVSTAIIVALWCIQQDMSLRPSMAKVVKIFEGVCPVPQPPTSSAMISSTMTSSGPTCCNSDAYLSAEHLSGPR